MNIHEFNKVYTAVPSGPGVSAATRITCGKCGAFADAVGGFSIDHAGFARIFSRRGWKVGSIARKHRCPACLNRQPAQSQAPQESNVPSLTVVNEPRSTEPRPPIPNASTQPPRELTREDRRLIIAKLEEVYVDERSGYANGWNDERVAKDLNVPRAWVELLRDENFGPQLTVENPAIKRLETDIEDAQRLLANTETSIKDIRQLQARLELAVEGVTQAQASLEGKVNNMRGELRRLTGR